MKNKTAIITGAGRGVGRAVAKGLAQDGFDLFLVDSCVDNLHSVADEVQQISSHVNINLSVLDVSESGAANTVVQKAIDITGKIDVLFNNAGILKLGTLDVANKDFLQMLQVNLMGAASFMQAVAPVMKENKSGHIINLASLAGKVGFAGYGAYAATKFGLVGLSESVCRELSPFGVKVSCICPSYIDTQMGRHDAQCDFPTEKIIVVEDIVEIVHLLLKLSSGCLMKEIVIECLCDLE